MILRREKIFGPERRSKVVKFVKNDRLEMLIILARDAQFQFSLENDPKGGPLGDFFLHSYTGLNSTIFFFYMFITSFPLNMIIKPHRIVVSLYTDTFWPVHGSQLKTQVRPSSCFH